MRIAGVQKSSFIDFPGMISTVLFLEGCNYSCYYCHNKNILKTSKLIDADSVFKLLYKRTKLIDGIVITGGEPTIQDDLIYLIKQIKQIGYKIKLDTNGSNPNVIIKIVDNKLIDYIAIDYKVPSYLYPKVTGCLSGPVLSTIEYIVSKDIDYEVRTTMIPEIRLKEFKDMVRELPYLKRYILQPYITPDKSLNESALKDMANSVKSLQPSVLVRE